MRERSPRPRGSQTGGIPRKRALRARGESARLRVLPRIAVSAGLIVAAGAAAFGCATRQLVSLECVPKDVSVYVDGRLLEDVPQAVKLAKDEPHTIFLKGGRYQPQMVVFENLERDGKPVLDPGDLCSRVAFVEVTPEVTIEVEPDTPGTPSR